MKNKNVTDAVVNFLEYCYGSLNTKKHLISVFIDFSKAFDVVDHGILLKKFDHIGIRGILLDWCKSFLSDRKQAVILNGHTSNFNLMSYGVPQGSFLGPFSSLYL